jgi:hypothetical protein
MDFQIVYDDNIDINGVIRAKQLILQSSPGNGNGSIMTSGTVSGTDITASGVLSGASVNSTGTVSGTDVTATGVLSGASVNSTGTVSGTDITASGTVTGGTVTSTGAVSGTNITASGTLSGATIISSGAMSGTDITASSTVTGATITSTGAVSGTNITASSTLTGATVKADIIAVNNGTTTLINAPRLPTSLSTGVTSGKYLQVADASGIIKLLQAPVSSSQYLGSNGTDLLWKTQSSISGTLNNWAILNEQYVSGNNPTHYNESIKLANSIAANGNQTYTRVFTNISESSSGSVITAKTGTSYTNAFPQILSSGTCYYDFTLGAGKYLFIGSFPASLAGASSTNNLRHYIRLESVDSTCPAIAIQGTHEVATLTVTRSTMSSINTFSSNVQLALKHYVSRTGSNGTTNLGVPAATSTPFYGTLLIIKLE